MTDLLPPSVTFVSAIPSQGSCGELSGTVSCNLGSIANGAAVTIPIVVTVQIPLNPEGFEVITSTATVLGAEFDPIQPNNSAEAITEVYTDDDSDGVGDLVEDGAPNDGDGNGDGLPDKDQENVTSLKNAVDERYVTITSEEGTGLVDVNATTNPSPEDSPSEEEFPAGFFSFEVEGLEPEAATTVELVLPEDTIIITYWKYGPTPDDIAPHWYEFLFDGTTGAFIDNNMVTIFFVDGQLGDDDLVANGKIVDAGAPIFAPADLLLVISDSPDPALVAETLTYTLVVTNTGPSLATDVVLTDTLTDARLPDLTFESATPSQGVCSIQFLVVTCDLGDIANQAEATVTIVVTPLENAGAVTITNTATVEANEADSDFTNNIAIELTDVDRQADSSVTITSDPDPVLVGRPLTYTLEVLNGGPSQTTKVTVTDVLPNEVIYESSRPSQGTCDHSDGIVLCYIGSLDNGASATVTILVRPTDVAGGTDLINTATVVSDVADFNPANDGATDNTSVLRSVDLSVDIADAPDPVEVGDRVTYVATITNAGPSLATGVVLTDTLPVGATFESASPSQGNCNEASGTLICNMGAIAKDASATVSITVIPKPETAGATISNAASVVAAEVDPEESNNSASQETTVLEFTADLSVTMTGTPSPVLVNNALTYTVTAVNAGPFTGTAVTTTVTLPAGVSFVSASTGCEEDDRTVTCALGGIVSGDSAIAVIMVTPSSAGELTGNVTVSSSVTDPVTENNVAIENTTVNPLADLSVSFVDSTGAALLGEQIVYTINVTNNGPSLATDVTLSISLPQEVTFVSSSISLSQETTFVSFTISQDNCSNGERIICIIGTLAVGESATVVLVVNPQSEGALDISASVTANEADTSASDNTSVEFSTVSPVADISITTEFLDSGTSSDEISYVVTITNNGPSNATGITFTDTWIGGIEFIPSASNQGNNCVEAGGTITCDLDHLDVGEFATFQIVIRATTAGDLSRVSNVAGGEFDPGLHNNTDEGSVVISTASTPGEPTPTPSSPSPTPSPSTQEVSPQSTSNSKWLERFLILSAILFSIGLYGALARRNLITVFMSIELMFNAVNIAPVAFSKYVAPVGVEEQLGRVLSGQVFALFVVAVAAAEIAVGLGLAIALYPHRETVDVTEGNEMSR